MCDCLEEKLRKERERAQRLAASGFQGGVGGVGGVGGERAFGPEGGYDEFGNWVPPRDPPSRFTPARIMLGTAGILFALLALFLKTADTSNSPFLNKLCHSYINPKQDPNADAAALEAKRQRCLEQKKEKLAMAKEAAADKCKNRN